MNQAEWAYSYLFKPLGEKMLCRGEKYRFCCDLSISTSAPDSGAGPTRSTHRATETNESAFWQEDIVAKHQ